MSQGLGMEILKTACEVVVASVWTLNLRSRAGSFLERRAREAGGRIKPGAQAPGTKEKKGHPAREAGGSAVARFTGWGA